MVNSTPKQKVSTPVHSPFAVVISENVFCRGMVVLLRACLHGDGEPQVGER